MEGADVSTNEKQGLCASDTNGSTTVVRARITCRSFLFNEGNNKTRRTALIVLLSGVIQELTVSNKMLPSVVTFSFILGWTDVQISVRTLAITTEVFVVFFSLCRQMSG